jgi:hypothetical protein
MRYETLAIGNSDVNLRSAIQVLVSILAVWFLLQPSCRADYIAPITELESGTRSGVELAVSGGCSASQTLVENVGLVFFLGNPLIPFPSMEWPTQTTAGSSGGGGSGGAGPSPSLPPQVVPLRMDSAGRLKEYFVICRPPPFPTAIFHPPRLA